MSTQTKRKKSRTSGQNGRQDRRSAPKAGKDKGKAPVSENRASWPDVDEAPEKAILDAEDKASREAGRPEADPIKYPPETLASRCYRATRAAEQAAKLRAEADDADRRGWGGMAASNRALAEIEERQALELATVSDPVVRGCGEMVVVSPSPTKIDLAFKETLENPTATSATASRVRMFQALQISNETLAQSLDAVETIGARNSLEKMAVHQMAAAHELVMKMMCEGSEMIRKAGVTAMNSVVPTAVAPYSIEGCRIISAAARLMGAYQNGLATLARIRQGGQQVVTVQHVQVSDGGQAVVAGQVTGGRGTDDGR